MLESRRSRIIASSAAVVGLGTATLVALNLGDDGEDGPPECPPLYQIDFEDGSYDPWLALGPAVIEVVDNDGNSVLSVSGRTDTWHGFESPTGGFKAGTMYDMSFDILLESTADVRFIAYDEGTANTYNWVGTTEVEAGEWTTITGSFAFSDTGQAASRVYIEVNSFGDYQVDNVLVEPAVCLLGGPEPGTVILETDFEDGLDGWEPRGDDAGPPNVSISDIAFEGEAAAIVTDRKSQGSGIGHEMTELMQPGAAYTVNAWVRFPDGVPTDAIWLTMRRTTGGEHTYDTLGQFVDIPNDDWVEVNATFTVGVYEQAFIYFETDYNETNTEDFLIDNISIVVPEPLSIEDLTPLMDTMNIPVGVAIDVRETSGAYAELVTKHFNQISAENHMKPDAWYNAAGEFSPHPDAIALMRFAADNNMGVYGHVLVWHAQTPEWFFQRDGQPLTNSAADQELLRERMRTHIFNVAEFLSDEWGPFGSDTNPLVAFDVVNEVIDDSTEYADGMRRSEWYAVLGEEFVDLAFIYADEAFNGEYAAEGADRPVVLFINDYNSEFAGKRGRYLDLIERVLDRGAPIDGIGHQFHLNLTVPASNVEQALRDTQRLGLIQVVTELDVPTGTPVSDALWVEQGYYYRDVFRTLRAFEDDLFAVTIWGLYDTRSWRDANGGPLLFDGLLQAKPAYFGAIDGDLPIPPRVVSMFRGSVPLDAAAFDAIEWKQLPLLDISAGVYFQTRWEPDFATIFVTVDDSTPTSEDAVEFQMGEQLFTVNRDGSGDVDAVARERDGGYEIVAQVPFESPLGQGRVARLDVRVNNDGMVNGWNQPGELGFLNLYEPVSYLEIVYTDTAPVIDGNVDAVWAAADVVTTDVQVQGASGAGAEVRTLWKDNMLYVLMEVTDPAIDVSGSDPWIQDSVEIYLDAGNAKNGAYRPIDTQIRINAQNVHSYGSGDEAEQAARVESVTVLTDTGYRVEVAIDMLNNWGAGSFHGVDFQVNDGVNGNRISVRNWGDPSDAAFQSTARWGVGQLVVR